MKYYARIPPRRIKAALKVIEDNLEILGGGVGAARRIRATGSTLHLELKLAARMAAQSCRFMLWQQVLAAGNKAEARKLASLGLRELRQLEKDFVAYWPARNKGTIEKCAAFLRWRMADYRRGTLPSS